MHALYPLFLPLCSSQTSLNFGDISKSKTSCKKRRDDHQQLDKTIINSLFTQCLPPVSLVFPFPLFPASSYRRVFCYLSQASLNFDDPTLKALIEALPEAPARAQRMCLERCGLLDDDRKYDDDRKKYDDDDKKH